MLSPENKNPFIIYYYLLILFVSHKLISNKSQVGEQSQDVGRENNNNNNKPF